MTLEEMMEKEGFSTPERVLVQNVGAPDIRYRNAATILAAKKYERAIDRLIVSNEKLGKSNEKHAAAATGFTYILVMATIIEIALNAYAFTWPLPVVALLAVLALASSASLTRSQYTK